MFLKRSMSNTVHLDFKKKKGNATHKADQNDVLFSKSNCLNISPKVNTTPVICKIDIKLGFLTNKAFKCKKVKKQLGVIHRKKTFQRNNLKQKTLDEYFCKKNNAVKSYKYKNVNKTNSENRDKDTCLKCTEMNGRITVKTTYQNNKKICESNLRRNDTHTNQLRASSSKKDSPKKQDIIKSSYSDASKKSLNPDSLKSNSPKRHIDISQHSFLKSKLNSKSSTCAKIIPHYKIVAETHFAVDAFSYGNIPNVKHYFLTHFHSDHYTGLKKGFKNMLYCSKITGDLCTSRLNVSPSCVNVIDIGETIKVDGIDVTAVDANHCPGAIMLVFTLPNGKTILHTGDFRATPLMESYPIFWNKDIHSIYLDTTYCNPRYNFPTQDESIEMAMEILRQKRSDLEKVGKAFSTVLIVCGTYTIGKEKFFYGLARRLGCGVWACPSKDSVLRLVEGRSARGALPHACQLHVLPMRDIAHEKLQSYLTSFSSAFDEVVAFKPSGWENGKNATVKKDSITIHGVPYSEHSSFPEMIRFVNFLQPKQVIPTVDIPGGVKAVQKYFKCCLADKAVNNMQNKITDYYKSTSSSQKTSAIT